MIDQEASQRQKSNDARIKETVFALLHSPPSIHGINRSTWRFADLQAVLRKQGQPLCRDVIRCIIRGAGYKWRKARVVLTSNDPEYKVKVEAIQEILSQLKEDEAFFSIDEYGPFAVKKRGGRKRVGPGEIHGSAKAEIEGVPDHYRSAGTIAKPGDALLLKEEEYSGDDRDDGFVARAIP